MRRLKLKEVKFYEPVRLGDGIGTRATCPSEPPSVPLGGMCPRWHCPRGVAWKLGRCWGQSWPRFGVAGDEMAGKGCVWGRFLVCPGQSWSSLCEGGRYGREDDRTEGEKDRPQGIPLTLGPRPCAGSPEDSPQVIRLPASLTALLVGCATLGHGFAL